MQELLTNIHIHTTYSDGNKSHLEIIDDAASAGIDVVFFTDHNIYVEGIEGYYNINGKHVLVIMGEEIHDPNACPQKNHMLALGADKQLSVFSENRKMLISKVRENSGGAFIAHPYDPALPDFNQPDISWEDWSVDNFNGIELWNGFSEMKVRSKNKIMSYFFALFPKSLPLRPPSEAIKIWDKFHRFGRQVSAIAGSDAHGIIYTTGPFKRVVFPYTYHFSTINNHVQIKKELSGEFQQDKKSIVYALINGRNYLANDLIRSAVGFEFFIEENKTRAEMGEVIHFNKDQVIRLFIPGNANISLLHNGRIIEQLKGKGNFDIPLSSDGVYRIECYKFFRGRKRGWIFSNPIYVR